MSEFHTYYVYTSLIMNRMNLSFAGCGFLGLYHLGVVSCIKTYAPGLFTQTSGASAGSIAALAMLIDDVDVGKNGYCR